MAGQTETIRKDASGVELWQHSRALIFETLRGFPACARGGAVGTGKGAAMGDTWTHWMSDPAAFAKGALEFEPDGKQARWCVDGEAKVAQLLAAVGEVHGSGDQGAAPGVVHAESMVLVVSPSERQSGEFLEKATDLVRVLGEKPRGDGRNAVSLLFKNGSPIVGIPGKESTVRGFSKVSLLLVDEASRVPDDLYKSVRPMLAVSNGDLWLMSTPRGRRGFFWETWSKKETEWTRIFAPATECSRITKEFLEEERRDQGDRWFRQEYLGEFLETDDQVFRDDLIERAFTDRVKPLIFD